MGNNVVEIVDNILKKALNCAVSDIHFESIFSGLKVRLRIDGLLHELKIFKKDLSKQILARVKILAQLDVAEKRIPQDGKFELGERVNCRVSTFPCLYGEKIVIRLLKKNSTPFLLEDLGMESAICGGVKSIIEKANGFFLVVGPTGSGKSTTLYSALSHINKPEKNIVTLEDPIEYGIENVNQSQINPAIKFDFLKGMRSILRQDPDVVMVGEIRDFETAQTAIQAALTGHLVLSSLHTKDAIGTVIRFLDMGIPEFLINGTLSGVLSQRLVRVLCEKCKYKDGIREEEQNILGLLGLSLNKIYRAEGCDFCNNIGFKGRTGIFELLIFNQKMRNQIAVDSSYDKIYQAAIADGFWDIRQDAAKKIEQGITSLLEVSRVLF